MSDLIDLIDLQFWLGQPLEFWFFAFFIVASVTMAVPVGLWLLRDLFGWLTSPRQAQEEAAGDQSSEDDDLDRPVFAAMRAMIPYLWGAVIAVAALSIFLRR